MTDNKTLQKIDVFISSPSDVQAERDAIYQIVTAINEEPSVRERYVLKPLAYERLVPPEVGDKPQKVVDKYMREAGKADLFIGVLWSRMGTPVTDDDGTEYQSGTEYEFVKAYESRTSSRAKPIMLLYRSLQPIPPTADFEQIGRVQTFFKRFEGDAADFKGLYKTYTSLDEFKTLIRKHLLEVLAQIAPDADDKVQPAAPIRRRADHYQHIPLPTNYVERTDLLTELRRALIGDSAEVALTSALKTSTPQNPTALHGMGGIGKSVMARALCDDPQVHAAFPDGILWATCGQTPNLVQQLRGWIKAFNETPDDKAELDDLKAHAAKLLASRACLLIIDDVWDKAHAQAFRVGGANCRTIITTRDEAIAEELGAKIERIPPMSEPDAISLLELWAKDNLTTVSHADKAKIVNRVGRLALAIKLAGGQLIRQSVEDWLKGFDVHKLKSRRPDSSNPHDSLEVCFGLSLSQLAAEDRRLYAALSIFREDEPILERAVAKLWDAYGDSDASATSDLIDDLGARALLEITAVQYPRAFILHDLLREFMNSELGSNHIAAHEALISAYAETQTGNGWPSAPDDGYLYTHLAYHLHEAGRSAELYALLTDSPAWMRVKYVACMGDRSYVDDLELAINDFKDPLNAIQILALTKLWTARQVINARVSAFEDIDLQTLVWLGRTQEALAHAELRQTRREQVGGLVTIASTLSQQKKFNKQLLIQAEASANFIDDLDTRAYALASIARTYVDNNQPESALRVFEKVVQVIDQAGKLYSTDSMKFFLIPDFAYGGQFELALQLIQTISEVSTRDLILIKIVDAYAIAKRFDEAIQLAQTITTGGHKTSALGRIAGAYATNAQFDKAISIVSEIQHTDNRDEALLQLAISYAQYDQENKAFHIVQSIKNPRIAEKAPTGIALALAIRGSCDRALNILNELDIHSLNQETANAVIHIYAKCGHINDALNLARATVAPYQGDLLRNLANYLARNGQAAQSEDVLKEAHNLASLKTQSHSPDEIFYSLAKALRQHELPIVATQIAGLIQKKERYDVGKIIEKPITLLQQSAEDTSLDTTGIIDYAMTLDGDTLGDNERVEYLLDVTYDLAQKGQFNAALKVANAIHFTESYNEALANIACAYALYGRFNDALALARSIEEQYRMDAMFEIATMMGIDKQFQQAFETQGIRDLPTFLLGLTSWFSGFEAINPEFGLDVLREALRIISWQTSQWGAVEAILQAT